MEVSSCHVFRSSRQTHWASLITRCDFLVPILAPFGNTVVNTKVRPVSQNRAGKS